MPDGAPETPGERADRELGEALFSTYFHAMLARDDAGHRQWASRRPGGRGSAPKPMDFDQAIELLRVGPSTAGRVDPQHALAHAAAILAWAAHRARPGEATRLRDALALLSRQSLTTLDSMASAGHSSSEVFLAVLQNLGLATCVTSLSWSGAFDIDLQVTTVDVSAHAKGRHASAYATVADPRNWHAVAPLTFLRSCQMDPRKSPDDVFPPPPCKYGPPPGNSWANGYLFEHAQVGLSPFAFSQLRNVLGIDFSVRGQGRGQGAIDMRYRLVENLTQRVLGVESIGGTDVDSGTMTVIDSGNGVDLAASKSFRFAAPPALKSALNWTSLPLMIMWMVVHVVSGACP